MTNKKQPIFIKAETIYKVSVFTYIFAYAVFLFGWYMRGNFILPTLFCLPLIAMTPNVIGKKRRYYQFIPNILVLYIGWALAEIFINRSMHLYGSLALLSWVFCLGSMLLLVRTHYLILGGHYESERKKKKNNSSE